VRKKIDDEKRTIKDMSDLCEYASRRAAKSARRNDPVAWAYWNETSAWARGNVRVRYDEALILERAHEQVGIAVEDSAAGRFWEAALAYSRAKWMVTIGRNLGFRLAPKRTGVNLEWLRKAEADSFIAQEG